MRFLFTLLLLGTSFHLLAQKEIAFPVYGATEADFVPAGWKIVSQAKGGLNKDSLIDIALIIQNTDAKNFIINKGLGTDTIDTNPRVLLILFKEKATGKYKLAEQNDAFIPSAGSEENTCLADPLGETDGVTITKGVLGIHLQYWYSCGSWYTSNHDWLFRFQHQRFELIGLESNEMHRSSGDMSNCSVNFSTHKVERTSGGNEFDDKKDKPKKVITKLANVKAIPLQSLTVDAYEKIQEVIDGK